MALSVPIADWIEYGKISQYLAANDVARNWYYKGGDLVQNLSIQIQNATRLVEFKYNSDNDDETLEDTGRYLYALCGKYIRQAQRIITSGDEGQLINPSTGQAVTILPLLVQFVVGEVGALMTVGQTQLVLNYTGILDNSISIDVDGSELPINRSDRFSFTAVVVSGSATVTFNAPVSDGMLIMLHATRLINV